MKTTILFTISMFCTLFTHAQSYSISSYIGDDGDYFSGGYVYDYLYPSNNLSSWYDLPFDWTFYGQPVSGYKIAHDGYITFNNSTGISNGNNTNLPNISGPNNAIFACWDDFTTDVTISVKTFGTAPNRIHNITWAGLNYPGAAWLQDDITVALNIYESCGDFEVVFKRNKILPTSTYYSMINTTIGCQNSTGTIGTQLPGCPNYIPSDPGYDADLFEVHRFSWNNPVVYDASLVTIRTDNHLTVGNHTLEGAVRNEGDANLTSYDINYTLNNGAVQTASINTAPSVVKNSYISEWSHPVAINVASSSDTYELKVWVSNINGQSDENSCNDTLTEYITGIQNISADKKVLIEKNTGTWCGYCSDGVAIMDDLVTQHGEAIIPVVVHDGDEMEFVDSLRTSFAISSYPGALIDRSLPVSYGPYSKESIGRGSWSSRVADQLTKFTPLNISIDHTWNANTRAIVADVSVEYVDNSAGDTRIVLMIVEDSLTGTGNGWDQANNYNNTPGHDYFGAGDPYIVGFMHKHVLRDYAEGGCFGVDNIIPHFVPSGISYIHTYNYTLPPAFDANQITLVAAVVKYAGGNDAGYIGVRGQKNVYNAEAVHLMDFSTSVIALDKADYKIYPNPTTGNLTIDLGAYKEDIKINLSNSLGQIIFSQHYNSSKIIQLNLAKPTGLYLLQIECNGTLYTHKVVIE